MLKECDINKNLSYLHQARLEEDFKAAQELLETREAEILQLTEEVEDAPPLPLPTPLPLHPDMDLKVSSPIYSQVIYSHLFYAVLSLMIVVDEKIVLNIDHKTLSVE